MNIHDWTRVDGDAFHSFHQSWIAYLKNALRPLLPAGFYAASEQHMGRKTSDILGLHRSPPDEPWPPPISEKRGAVAIAEHVPAVDTIRTLAPVRGGQTLTIRHRRGHRIVALIEIVSGSNKNTEHGVIEFVDKSVQTLRAGIHLAVLDLLPPTRHAPDGLLGAIERELTNEWNELPADRPLYFASYRADTPPTLYLQQRAIGQSIPDLPLFLTADLYVQLPLAATYERAYRDEPDFVHELLEGPAP